MQKCTRTCAPSSSRPCSWDSAWKLTTMAVPQSHRWRSLPKASPRTPSWVCSRGPAALERSQSPRCRALDPSGAACMVQTPQRAQQSGPPPRGTAASLQRRMSLTTNALAGWSSEEDPAEVEHEVSLRTGWLPMTLPRPGS